MSPSNGLIDGIGMRSVIRTPGVARADDPCFGAAQMATAIIIGRSTATTNPTVTTSDPRAGDTRHCWRSDRDCVFFHDRPRTVRRKYSVSAGQLASELSGLRTECNVLGLASLGTARRGHECITPGRTACAWRQQDSPWAILESFVIVYGQITYYDLLKITYNLKMT